MHLPLVPTTRSHASMSSASPARPLTASTRTSLPSARARCAIDGDRVEQARRGLVVHDGDRLDVGRAQRVLDGVEVGRRRPGRSHDGVRDAGRLGHRGDALAVDPVRDHDQPAARRAHARHRRLDRRGAGAGEQHGGESAARGERLEQSRADARQQLGALGLAVTDVAARERRGDPRGDVHGPRVQQDHRGPLRSIARCATPPARLQRSSARASRSTPAVISRSGTPA